jgi:hypothetical protein
MSLGSCLLNRRYKHSFSKGPLPLCKRQRVIEPVLHEVFRAAGVHPGHLLTGPKEEYEEHF